MVQKLISLALFEMPGNPKIRHSTKWLTTISLKNQVVHETKTAFAFLAFFKEVYQIVMEHGVMEHGEVALLDLRVSL